MIRMRILYGPPGDSSQTPFFNRLPDDPQTASSTLWITPTQRKRQWVQDRFRDCRRVFPPRIHIFDELIAMLFEHLGGTSRLLSPESVQAVLMNLLHDPGMTPILSRWFDQPPGPGFLLETARQINEFQRHGIAPDTLAAIPDSGEDIGLLFNLMYTRYQDYLAAHGWIDTGGMGLWVADQLPHSGMATAGKLPWNTCVMDGFLELTPLQLDILKSLDKCMELTLIWPGNPSPEGLFRWMNAGLNAMFPDAGRQPLVPQAQGLAAAAYHLAGYGPDVLPEDIVPTGPPDGLRIIERDTLRDEVTAIARDIRTRRNAGQLNWREFAVTFPDLQAYAPVIRRIFHRYGIPVNISQSLPITGSPVFIAIDRLLRLPAGWLRDDVLAVMSDPILTGLHPHENRTLTRRLAEWSSLHKIVRGLNRWTVALERIMAGQPPDSSTAALAATALQLIRRFSSVLEDGTCNGSDCCDSSGAIIRTSAQWIGWLRTVLGKLEINRNIEKLQRLVITEMESGSEHFEYTRRAYNRLLEYFDATEPFLIGFDAASCSAGGRAAPDKAIAAVPHTPLPSITHNQSNGPGLITAAGFRAILPRMLTGVDYQLTTRSGNRVQVLGLLGIRGLTFRHVYFGGMTELVFPRRETISPFWRPDLKTTILDQPDHNERITAFADLVRVMSAPTGTLTLSRPCRNGDEKLLPSPLWSSVLAVFPQHERITVDDERLCVRDRLETTARDRLLERISAAPVRIAMAVAGLRRSSTGRWCSDLAGVPGTAREILDRMFDETHSFSASQLESYRVCPRRFFFDRVLELREPESPDDEMSAMDRGTLVHRVLHRFYRERLECGLMRVKPGEERSCAQRIREIATEEFDATGYAGEAARRQYLDITGRPELDDEGIAGRFARMEAEGSQALQPAFLEWAFGRKSTAPPLKLADHTGKPVLIEGKIDRLDRCDGDAVIWDYKTGRLPGPGDITEFRSIQIGLYMLAATHILGHPVNAGGYCHLPGRSNTSLRTCIRLEGSGIDSHLPKSGHSNQLDRLWPPPEFAGYFIELTDIVAKTAWGIRRGAFPAATDAAACDNCEFYSLCHRTREIDHVRN